MCSREEAVLRCWLTPACGRGCFGAGSTGDPWSHRLTPRGKPGACRAQRGPYRISRGTSGAPKTEWRIQRFPILHQSRATPPSNGRRASCQHARYLDAHFPEFADACRASPTCVSSDHSGGRGPLLRSLAGAFSGQQKWVHQSVSRVSAHTTAHAQALTLEGAMLSCSQLSSSEMVMLSCSYLSSSGMLPDRRIFERRLP